MKARAYLGPGRQNVLISISINRSALSECGTYLVYHIDEGLCVSLKKATDCVACIVTRENGPNQGGEFMRSERTSDQTPAGWSVDVEKEEEPGGNQRSASDGEDWVKGIPLSGAGVLAVSTGDKLLSAHPS